MNNRLKQMMRYLFCVYQWLIVLPILTVATFLCAVSTIVGCLIDKDWWSYYPPKWWSRLWCKLLFVKVEVRGQEKIHRKTSYVFVANHQGAFDIFSIYGYLQHDFKWMMRKGLAKIPLVGYACRSAGHIMVDRSSPEALKQTMQTAKERLQGGKSIVVFPEGRRTDDGRIQPFKNGAYRLAVDFGLLVVPITIDGSYGVMPRSTYNVRPGKIILTIHAPIQPGHNGHDLVELVTASREAIISALPAEQH